MVNERQQLYYYSNVVWINGIYHISIGNDTIVVDENNILTLYGKLTDIIKRAERSGVNVGTKTAVEGQ